VARVEDINLEILEDAKIQLSEQEIKDYTDKSTEWVHGMIKHELSGEESGWKLTSKKDNGQSCYLKYEDDNPICLVKGTTEFEGKLEDMRDAMMGACTSELLREEMKKLDPMFNGGALLHIHQENDDLQISLMYNNFSLAPGDLIWDRDMLFIQHIRMMDDESRNQRVVVAACGSVARPELPELPHLKRVRGDIRNTGYIFRELGEGRIGLSYIVQVDPKGALPKSLVNLSAESQADNAHRMRVRVHDSLKACKAMGVAPMTCENVRVGTKKVWKLRINPYEAAGRFLPEPPKDGDANRVQNLGIVPWEAENYRIDINFLATGPNFRFRIEGLHLEDLKGLSSAQVAAPGQFLHTKGRGAKAGKPYRVSLVVRRSQRLILTWANDSYLRSSIFFYKIEVVSSHEGFREDSTTEDPFWLVHDVVEHDDESDTFSDYSSSAHSSAQSSKFILAQNFRTTTVEKGKLAVMRLLGKSADLDASAMVERVETERLAVHFSSRRMNRRAALVVAAVLALGATGLVGADLALFLAANLALALAGLVAAVRVAVGTLPYDRAVRHLRPPLPGPNAPPTPPPPPRG